MRLLSFSISDIDNRDIAVHRIRRNSFFLVRHPSHRSPGHLNVSPQSMQRRWARSLARSLDWRVIFLYLGIFVNVTPVVIGPQEIFQNSVRVIATLENVRKIPRCEKRGPTVPSTTKHIGGYDESHHRLSWIVELPFGRDFSCGLAFPLGALPPLPLWPPCGPACCWGFAPTASAIPLSAIA